MVRYDIKRVVGGRESYVTTVSSPLKEGRLFCMLIVRRMKRVGYDYSTLTVYRNEYPEEFVGCIREADEGIGAFIWTDREGKEYALNIANKGRLGNKV